MDAGGYAAWQIIKPEQDTKTTKQKATRRSPARFASRHPADMQSKKRKGQDPTKTTTNKDLPWTQQRAKNKNTSSRGKKHRNEKKVWQQEKNALERKKRFPQREKPTERVERPGESQEALDGKKSAAGKTSKKCRFAAGKIQSRRKKTPCSSRKTPWQQKNCILETVGKILGGRKKSVQDKKKPAEARKIAEKKTQLCNPKSRRNGTNTFPQREKEQPFCAQTRTKRSETLTWL